MNPALSLAERLPSPLAGEGSGERETVMAFMIEGACNSHDR
jgi:hypothetical protein